MNKWLLDNEVLSFNQKGFLSYDGVFENNFALDYYFRQAKTKRRDFIASLDIWNSFGSLPHWAIFAALDYVGVGERITNIILKTITMMLSLSTKLVKVALRIRELTLA